MTEVEDVALRRVTVSIKDGTHGTHERVADGVPLLSAKNVVDGRIVMSDAESLIAEPDFRAIHRTGYLRPGDVLLTIVGSIGRVAIFDMTEPVAFQRSVASIRPDPSIETAFLAYVMQSAAFQEALLASVRTSAQSGVYLGDLATLPVPLVPLTHQREIADFLDAEMARIDALIEKKQGMIALLRERFMSGRRGEFDRLTSSYGEITLRRCVRCLDGRRIPLNAEERAVRPGPYPYWGAGTVVDYIDEYLFDEALVLLGEDGAPFFDKSRDVAFYVSERIWVNNHIHVLRPNSGWLPRFLMHMLNAVDFSAYITGSTRDKLTQSEMDAIRLPAAPVNEQPEVVNELDRLLGTVGSLRDRLSRQIDLLREHSQALITAAVTGQLDVATATGSSRASESRKSTASPRLQG